MAKYFFIALAASLCSCTHHPTKGTQNNTTTHTRDSILLLAQIDSVTRSHFHPEFDFDTILKVCMEINNGHNEHGAGTTMGSIDCYYDATTRLDSMVEQTYIKLYAKLDKEDKIKLKTSQSRWRRYQETEDDFIASAYYTWANFSKYGHGREHAIASAEWRYNITHARLVQLTLYEREIFVVDSLL